MAPGPVEFFPLSPFLELQKNTSLRSLFLAFLIEKKADNWKDEWENTHA